MIALFLLRLEVGLRISALSLGCACIPLAASNNERSVVGQEMTLEVSPHGTPQSSGTEV